MYLLLTSLLPIYSSVARHHYHYSSVAACSTEFKIIRNYFDTRFRNIKRNNYSDLTIVAYLLSPAIVVPPRFRPTKITLHFYPIKDCKFVQMSVLVVSLSFKLGRLDLKPLLHENAQLSAGIGSLKTFGRLLLLYQPRPISSRLSH